VQRAEAPVGVTERVRAGARAWILAGLVTSATASHLLRAIAGSPRADTAEIHGGVLAGVYLASLAIGYGLGCALQARARVRARARTRKLERASRGADASMPCALALGLVVNLALLWIVHGIGGGQLGRLLLALGIWPSLSGAFCLVVAAWLACLELARSAHAARITGVAGVFWLSALAVDARDAVSIHASRQPLEPPVQQLVEAPDPATHASVIHLIFDEFPGTWLELDDTLRDEGFHRLAPSGVLFEAAYTNSIWTHRAIPQLLSGRRSPASGDPEAGDSGPSDSESSDSQSGESGISESASSERGSGRFESGESASSDSEPLLARYHAGGYRVRRYLGASIQACHRVAFGSCFSRRWVWKQVVAQGDWDEFLRIQLRQLGAILLERFVGDLIHSWEATALARMPASRSEQIHARGLSPSLVLYDRFLDDLASEDAPTYYFVHLLIPHHPFVHDSECRIVRDPTSLGRNVASRADPAYLAQVRCANRLARSLIERLIELDRYDSTRILIQSDHGPRRELLDLVAGFSSAEHEFSASESALLEASTRILLWYKPAGATTRSIDREPIQLVQVAERLLAPRAGPGPGSTLRQTAALPKRHPEDVVVLGLDAAAPRIAEITFVKSATNGSWHSVATAP